MTGAPSTDPSSAAATTPSTTDVAKEQTRSVGEDAKEGGRHVAEVAKEETRSVAEDTRDQARDLWEQTRSELSDQAGQQQRRVADGLRSLGRELSSMAQGSQEQGLASDLAGRGAQQANQLAEYLDGRDPGSLLEEVRRFARRRPGTFLAVAAGVGVAAGRLSRGMMPEQRDDGPTGGTGAHRAAAAGRVDTVDPVDPGMPGASSAAGYAPATAAARDTGERAPYTDPLAATDPTGSEPGTWETRP